ncbi:MAG TPA: YbjN domain-containing protein [Byssovorax sp.]|jgi:hypothetical protein
MDRETVDRWLSRAGFATEPARDGAVLVVAAPRSSTNAAHLGALPPLYMQLTENWVLLSMLPMVDAKGFVPDDVNRRLLAVNREMRIAKFALDGAGSVVLCAELPTESLDESELTSAIDRIVEYAREFDGGRGIL